MNPWPDLGEGAAVSLLPISDPSILLYCFAVVALRQAERQAARDKARSEELAKLQESAMQQETARLEGRLRELERDKNLLMVNYVRIIWDH